MFELAHLHVLNRLKLYFWNIVLVHVKQDILYHDDAQFLVGPETIERLDKLIISLLQNFFRNRL
jgi:hypothetical protein